MKPEIAEQVARVAASDAAVRAQWDRDPKNRVEYWDAGYLDVPAAGGSTFDDVFTCQSPWGEPISLKRRYFSDADKALLQRISDTLRVRYPMARLNGIRYESFAFVDTTVIDVRECAPFDAADTDWELEEEIACA